MNEVSEAKIREVVPDLINKVGKMRELTQGLKRSIDRLDDALTGTKPRKSGDEVDPDDHELGSIESLERMVDGLYRDINDADLELRDQLNLLLGA